MTLKAGSKKIPDKTFDDVLSEAAVADYLRSAPNFFSSHPDLLDTLTIPHISGDAVSLVMGQLCQMRSKKNELQQQLAEIIAAAHDNEVLFRKLQRLTLALLSVHSLHDAISTICVHLQDDFALDLVAIRLLSPQLKSLPPLFGVPPSDTLRAELEQFVAQGEPGFSMPTGEGAAFFFGESDPSLRMKSVVMMPLKRGELSGILILGSLDASRFQSGMGHQFLQHFTEIVAARLLSLL